MRSFLFAIAALFLLLFGMACHAISGNEQLRLAGSSRYLELSEKLEEDEQAGPLRTVDLHALCFAYAKLRHYGKLMPCLVRLEQNAAKGDRRTRLFGLDDVTPLVHVMRAEALVELSQPAEALKEANQALAWYFKTRSDDQDIAIDSYAVKTLAALALGNRNAAINNATDLEQVDTRFLHSDFKTRKAMAVARINLALGNYEKAYRAILDDSGYEWRVYLDKLVGMAFIHGENTWLWQQLPRAYILNRALWGIGKKDQARDGYDKLLAVPQIVDNGDLYWLILFDRGRLAEEEGDFEKAIDCYRKAIDVIEEQRSYINTEAAKIGFVSDKQVLYAKLVKLLFRQDRRELAFEYIERSRSRALVDMLAAKNDFALPEQSRQSAGSLLVELANSELQTRLQYAASTYRRSRQPSDLQQVKAKLRATSPELASLVSVSVMPTTEVQQKLAPDETLVEYFQQENDLYVVVMKRNAITTRKLQADNLNDLVRSFRAAIDKRRLSARDASAGLEEVKRLSVDLYKQIIAPIEKDIAGTRLSIVPYGPLHYLPFIALNDGKQYLVEKYDVRFLPSASVLEYLQKDYAQNDNRMLILGNPDLGDKKYDLPGAQSEAQAIAKMLKNAKLLLRKDASETAFRQQAPAFPLIHIASHGQFSSESPLSSALLLAPEGGNDGRLTVDKLYSLRLNASLITLSACETGLGQVSSGDDVIGLNRGFLYAGANTIVSSLWEVDDDATSALMLRFYQLMGQHGKGKALNMAQREIIKKYPHPYFWSAFYLTGNVD